MNGIYLNKKSTILKKVQVTFFNIVLFLIYCIIYVINLALLHVVLFINFLSINNFQQLS